MSWKCNQTNSNMLQNTVLNALKIAFILKRWGLWAFCAGSAQANGNKCCKSAIRNSPAGSTLKLLMVRLLGVGMAGRTGWEKVGQGENWAQQEGENGSKVCLPPKPSPYPRLQNHTQASLVLHPLEREHRSKEIHWDCCGFTQGEGTNVHLPLWGTSSCPRPTGYSSGHFRAAVPLGTKAA